MGMTVAGRPTRALAQCRAARARRGEDADHCQDEPVPRVAPPSDREQQRGYGASTSGLTSPMSRSSVSTSYGAGTSALTVRKPTAR